MSSPFWEKIHYARMKAFGLNEKLFANIVFRLITPFALPFHGEKYP
jgi:hypothetical protein